MTQQKAKTVGELRDAIDHWQTLYREAARMDDGARLLGRAPGVTPENLIDAETDVFVLALTAWLLSERVPVWEDADEPVSADCWRRVQHRLRTNSYGGRGGRYLLRFFGARDCPLALTAGSLGGPRPDTRVGDLYTTLGYDLLSVTDLRRPWTVESARRIGGALVRQLSSDHRLVLQISTRPDEMLLGVQVDHDRTSPARRANQYVESAIAGLRSAGYHCGRPTSIARNARTVTLSRRRTIRPALLLLPDRIPRTSDDVLLLPTSRVLADYSVLVVPEATAAIQESARRSGTRLRTIDDLLRDQNRHALSLAVRQLVS